MRLYVFHRDGMFYPLMLSDDADAVANARCNPGTKMVTREPEGSPVWIALGDGSNEGLVFGAAKGRT